jgi:hypothetical protein
MGIVGLTLARLDVFINVDTQTLFLAKAAGVLLAFSGIARYVSGVPHTKRQVKICPFCYIKNDTTEEVCKKCKKPLQNNK